MRIKVRPDPQKALALRKMAEVTLERLQETNREKYPTNTLTDYYDSMHKLMEALTALEGVKVKGDGAHQELIEYISMKYGFDEQTRVFMQQMRDYWNRTSYEGFIIHKNYFILNQARIELIIRELIALLSE
ncbi:MAG: hypothetical protein ABIA93_06215 [Candidatus Woesearchaeota archaeon]